MSLAVPSGRIATRARNCRSGGFHHNLEHQRMSAIRVLVADDHGVVRKGITFLLGQEKDIEVVGEAEDGRQAVQLASELDPTVVIMDIAMPHLNGIDATAQITRDGRSGVIILSMYSDEEFLMRALTAGAKGYLLKDSAGSRPGAGSALGRGGQDLLQSCDRPHAARRLCSAPATRGIRTAMTC